MRVEANDDLEYVVAPYLTNKSRKPYTLVLDLDETLLHYEEKNEFEGELRIRPGADEFIEKMSQYYEVVIFTAAM